MDTVLQPPSVDVVRQPGPRAVVCGSYRRDPDNLRAAFDALTAEGVEVLSPASVEFVDEIEGFVVTAEDARDPPEAIEKRHIGAMRACDFVWLHVPNGYVGPSAALEVGVAHTLGIPVYAANTPSDRIIAQFVAVVDGPQQAAASARARGATTPCAPLRDLQSYYQRVALERGFENESARDILLLLVEELGELARSIRESAGLARAVSSDSDPAAELADAQLYLLHLANVIGVDLARAVSVKEQRNHVRYGRLAA